MADLSDWQERARRCADMWQLTGLDWLPDDSTARLAFCGSPDGDAVLKVSTVLGMIGTEAKALRHFGPRVAPQPLALSLDLESMLLPRLYVRRDLSTLYPNPEAEVEVWLSLYDEVVARSETPDGFPTMDEFGRVFEKVLTMGVSDRIAPLMHHAHEHRSVLMGLPSENRLLHGDLHHFNVLQDEDGRWWMIDPHGVVGNPLYELGALLRNPWPACYTEPGIRDRLVPRIELLANRLGLSPSLVALYGFYGAAISVAWSIEDGDGDFENMVVMAEALFPLTLDMR